MEHPAARLIFPPAIRAASIAFLNWYFNDLHHGPTGPVGHAEHEGIEYDWRPHRGLSRLILAHAPSGTVAVNAFDISRLGALAAVEAPPPFSLLMATWFDLCQACEWISDGDLAAARDALGALAEIDAHHFGTPAYR